MKDKITASEFKKLLKAALSDPELSSLLPQKETVKLIQPETPTELDIPEGKCVQIKHSVNTGDLIAAMGAIKIFYEVTKRKAIVMQVLDLRGEYYAGAVHPVTDAEGRQVTFNSYMYDMAKPLIESQEYVHGFEKYTGQRVDLDFDVVRGKTFVNLPHGPIQGWIPLAYPDLAFDISKPWMKLDRSKCPPHIKGQVAGKIILNFTERYRMKIDYYFLQGYAADLVFAGTEKEWWQFCNQWQLTIPRLEVSNFLDLAYALLEARFMVGNQSMCWGLAQALGVRRILEMCNFADNCFPNIGEHSRGYFYQVPAEHYFRTFYNDTK